MAESQESSGAQGVRCVRLHVRRLSGERVVLQAPVSWSVAQLRAALASALPEREQRLVFEGRELKSHDSIGDLPCNDEAIELTLIRRPPLQASWLERVQASADQLRKAPRSIRSDREVVLCAVSQRGDLLEVASEALRADEEVVLAALRWDAQVLAFAAPVLLESRGFALRAVASDGRALEFLSDTFREDREVVLAAVSQYGFMLGHAGDALRADKQVVLATVRQTGIALQCAAKEMYADREVVVEAVRQNGLALEFACDELRADREVVLTAVCQDGLALALAASMLRGDREVVLEAVSRQGRMLEFASEELQADRDVVLTAVRTSGMALRFASELLRCDREIVLTAVMQNGNMLEQAALPLRRDREVVLGALNAAGRTLLYAAVDLKAGVDVLLQLIECHGSVLSCAALRSDEEVQSLARCNIERTLTEGAIELREDPEVLMAMVKQHSNILNFASPNMRAHKELVLCAVRQNGLALKLAAEELRDDPEVVCAAVSQNGLALEFASEALRADRETVKCALHQDGQALQYAAETLRKDRELVMAAVEEDVLSSRFAAPVYPPDHFVIVAESWEDDASKNVVAKKAADDKKDASASCALRTAANGAEKDVIVSGDSPVGQTHTWSSRSAPQIFSDGGEVPLDKAFAELAVGKLELEEGELSDDGPDPTAHAGNLPEVSQNSDSDGEVEEEEEEMEEGEIVEKSSTGAEPGEMDGPEEDGGLEGLEGAGDTETEEAEPSSDGEVQDEKESSEDEPEEAQQDKQDQDESGAETEDEVGSENDSKQNQAGDGSVQKVVEETESAGENESTSDGELNAKDQDEDGEEDEEKEKRVPNSVRTPSEPPPRRSVEACRQRSRRRAAGTRNTSRRHTPPRARSRSARRPSVRVANRKKLPRRSEWAGTRIELGLSSRGRRSPSSSRKRRRRRSSTAPRTPRTLEVPKERRTNLRLRAAQGQSKWDVRPDPTNPDQQPMKLLLDPTANGKKRRECYVGNLPQHKVDVQTLRQAFNRLFLALPSFVERYPDISDVVRALYFPPRGDGMFAFVEFVDDVITTTAVQMSGFELEHRAIKIGRPQNYTPPQNGELPALDVQPLRDRGLLPPSFEDERVGVANVLREVYFGNLACGMVDVEVMRELLQPAAVEVPEYDPELGPPIGKVTIAPTGNYCFVQFQSAAVATRMISIFDETELFGRRIRVGRPSKYATTVNECQLSLPPPSPPPAAPVSAPPLPPVPLAPHYLVQAANAELVAELASGR
ncbi:unnamed protein product [Symbiodinium natans]|uniref:Uncharacterized protein n=1 Tax=Symbiodinium natans TaxID=878477 RepID=A0A812GDR4_9DINO|nr:unnamed protein product [Symbiodinium natans]